MKQFAELVSILGTSTKTNDKLDALAGYFATANDKDKVWVIAIFIPAAGSLYQRKGRRRIRLCWKKDSGQKKNDESPLRLDTRSPIHLPTGLDDGEELASKVKATNSHHLENQLRASLCSPSEFTY